MLKDFKKNYPNLYSFLELSLAFAVGLMAYDAYKSYVQPTIASLVKGDEQPKG